MEKDTDLKISDMLKLSKDLWELHKDTWSPMEPAYGRNSILYMIEEIGEVIAIVKKKGEENIMEDPVVRERFVEELGDVVMYFMDVLNRYHISAEEFSNEYLKKMETNMKRDYAKQYKELK